MTDADAERDAAIDNALEWERIALERKDLLDEWREDHARLYAAVDRHLAALAEVAAELSSMSAGLGSAPDMRNRALALARRVEAESDALRRRTDRRVAMTREACDHCVREDDERAARSAAMTPRERVELIARIAWGVSHVEVSAHPDPRGVRVFVSASGPSGQRHESAAADSEETALRTLAAALVARVETDAARLRALAAQAEGSARQAERIAHCLAVTLAREESG